MVFHNVQPEQRPIEKLMMKLATKKLNRIRSGPIMLMVVQLRIVIPSASISSKPMLPAALFVYLKCKCLLVYNYADNTPASIGDIQ
jgi:hypothetical protein